MTMAMVIRRWHIVGAVWDRLADAPGLDDLLCCWVGPYLLRIWWVGDLSVLVGVSLPTTEGAVSDLPMLRTRFCQLTTSTPVQ